jgi:hypothetical protein
MKGETGIAEITHAPVLIKTSAVLHFTCKSTVTAANRTHSVSFIRTNRLNALEEIIVFGFKPYLLTPWSRILS